jgi:hypothetical protein
MKFTKAVLFLLVFLSNYVVAKESKIKYITQILEPLGGKIEKPIDWFYKERHGGPSLIWILSEENPDLGAYTTGVKIQAIMGFSEIAHKTPEIFINEFIQNKKENVEILNECAPQEQDFFTRVCLGTLEEITFSKTTTIFHIQYSLFWNNEMDAIIIVTAGTSEELWEKYANVFDKMNQFELIDMDRFVQ